MHRRPVLDLLTRYQQRNPSEQAVCDRIRSLVQSHEDCLLRTCRPGHITASAWILNPDRSHFLLTHHRKLKRWLQLGGHVDGEAAIEQAALREAQEESGIDQFDWVFPGDSIEAVDIDIHLIPERAGEPEHEHHDIRFVLIAADENLKISKESLDLRWFPLSSAEEILPDESVSRLCRKAQDWLQLRP